MSRRAVVVAMVMALTACAASGSGAEPGTATPSGPVAASGPVGTVEPAEQAGSARASGSPTATPAPDTLSAEIRQSRSDWGARRVQVRVVNGGSTPVDVTTATLTTSIVDGPPMTSDPARGRSVPPGRYRDFPVALGTAACPAQDAPASSVVVVLDDGREVRLTPGDPQAHLARINREDCAERRVRDAVRLELGPTVTSQVRDGRLVGGITLTATATDPGAEVGIARVDGTVLLSPLGGPSWAPPELAAVGSTAVTTVLEFLPGRCDPHAVAEDKRGTFLSVHVVIDGEELPVVHLAAPEALRGRLYDHIAAACGW